MTTQKYLLDAEGETSRRKDIATSADLEEQDYFVGGVELEWLHMVAYFEGRLQRFKGSGRRCSKSWHSLVKHLTHFKAIRTFYGEPSKWINQEA